MQVADDDADHTASSLTRNEIEDFLAQPTSTKCLPLLDKYFPQLAFGTTPDQLAITVRTRNFLHRLFLDREIARLEDLGKFTLDQLLQRQNFGRRSLLNLLEAALPFFAQGSLPAELHTPRSTLASHSTPANSRAMDYPPTAHLLCPRLTVAAESLRAKFYSSRISCDDLRFRNDARSLLAAANSCGAPVPLKFGDTIQAAAHRLTAREHDPSTSEDVIACIQRLRRAIARAHRISLEQELRQIAASVVSKRNLQLALEFYGWTGTPPKTLQATGDLFGITRERVRQVTTRFAGMLVRFRPYCPRLTHAIRIIHRNMHLPITQIQRRLFSLAILKNQKFPLESVASAAQAFGRSVKFRVDRLHNIIVRADGSNSNVVKIILQLARKLISHYGAITISDLYERLCNMPEMAGIEQSIISEVLQHHKSTAWLDEHCEWFSFNDLPRNHMVTIVSKVLSVSARIHVSEIRASISDDPRGLGFAPPKRVVLRFCELFCDSTHEDEFVVSNQEKQIAEFLSKAERIAYCVLKEYGPLLHRWKFQELCKNAGMNEITFSMYLNRSAILGRYGPGIYGLRGATFTESDLIRCIPEKTRRLSDQGWTQDAKPWAIVELSLNSLGTGIVSLPSAISAFVDGRFLIRLEDGSAAGTLVVRQTSAWGIKPFFRRAEVAPGDGVLFIFDLKSREAKVKCGSVSNLKYFLDEPQMDNLSIEADAGEGYSF